MEQSPKYYIVEASALPEIFQKVAEAKRMLETGETDKVNVAAQAAADRRRQAVGLKALLECRDALARLELALDHVVERDEVHMPRHAVDLFGQQVGLPVVVVHAVDHRVFKRDAAAGLLKIAVAGSKQLFHVVGFVHGHNAAARRAVGRVERNG